MSRGLGDVYKRQVLGGKEERYKRIGKTRSREGERDNSRGKGKRICTKSEGELIHISNRHGPT